MLKLFSQFFHLRIILSLLPLVLSFTLLISLSIFDLTLFFHGELIRDWVRRIITHRYLAVSVLATVEEHGTGAENHSVVWLELDWVC